MALRARIVLACAGRASNTEVAAQLGIAHPTVGKWRARFMTDRLDGLVDEPRPGAPRKITDGQVRRVVTDTLESSQPDATHWSRASMAAHSGLSSSTIGRIWKAFLLQPHRAETFKLSTDPLFIDYPANQRLEEPSARIIPVYRPINAPYDRFEEHRDWPVIRDKVRDEF